MTSRERFRSIWEFKKPDRLPFCEILGIHHESILRWHKEGMPMEWDVIPYGLMNPTPQRSTELIIFRAGSNNMDYRRYFSLEKTGSYYGELLPIDLGPIPRFLGRVVEETDRYKIIIDEGGVTHRVIRRRPGEYAMPQYLDWPVKSREDWENVKTRFDPDEPRRYSPSWGEEAIEYYQTVDHPVCLTIGGFYAIGRLLMGTKHFPYWFYKDPELMHDMMAHHADFLIGATREACESLRDKIDWVWWHEDMAHRHGPNISPKIFKEFMLPYYKKVSSHFNHYNIRNLCMDCDGDARLLMPLWWEGGIRGIVPLECTPGSKQAERFPTPESFQDIRKMRKEFSKWFFAGNIDKRALERGKDAIRNEVEYKVTFMKEGRGMIPSVDHLVNPGISFENYKYYLKNLKKLIFE